MNAQLLALAISQGKHPMARMLRDVVKEYKQAIRDLNSASRNAYYLPNKFSEQREFSGPVIPQEMFENVNRVLVHFGRKVFGPGAEYRIADRLAKKAAKG